jgi:hypothetical protein
VNVADRNVDASGGLLTKKRIHTATTRDHIKADPAMDEWSAQGQQTNMNNNRSEAAKKASATRKANKEAERQRQAQQQERREGIWNALPKGKQKEIGSALSAPMCVADDEYEELLADWCATKTEEIRDTFRALLRNKVSAKVILAGIEQGYIDNFELGFYRLAIEPESILQDVLLEDEFLGCKQPTPEAQQAVWELTETQ